MIVPVPVVQVGLLVAEEFVVVIGLVDDLRREDKKAIENVPKLD